MTAAGGGSAGWSNIALLVSLILLLVVEPFFPEQRFGSVVFQVLISVFLFAAIWTVSRSLPLLLLSLVLASPAVAARIAMAYVDGRGLVIAALLSAVLFLAFTTAVVLWRALSHPAVTSDTLAGAVCGYLMIGMVWALFYSLLEASHPGSFDFIGKPIDAPLISRHGVLPELLYLSLTTLTSVGYGDVLPVSPPARMVAALEGVVGQLYVAVLIARLVALHATGKTR